MDPRPPDRVPQDPGHRYRTGFPKRTRIILEEHVEVLSRNARCLRELLSVQRQVQVGLFEQPADKAANLRVEHNKVAAEPFAVATFRHRDQASLGKTMFPKDGYDLVVVHGLRADQIIPQAGPLNLAHRAVTVLRS
jgi:hypothetical protein